MERTRVSDLAKSLGISLTTAYKHLKQFRQELSAHIVKEKGIILLDREGVEMLTASIQATTVTPSGIRTPAIQPTVDLSPMTNRMEAMERAILMLCSEMKGLKEENASLRFRLERPIENLPADPPRQITPWSPEPKPDPLEGKPWYQRVWVSLVHPTRLRRWDN